MRCGEEKAWADVAVIVEGALAALQVFHDETALDAYVAEVRRDADADGLLTEVYVLWHEHSARLDGCGCAQHLSNRHVFGGAA